MINVLETPLVGRSTVVDALDAVMERPDLNGAIVFGEMGIGKTALAQHLLRRTTSDIRTFFVQGAEGLAAVPYGALAPLLDQVQPAALDSALTVLRSVMGHLRSESGGRTSLVIVDDAHLLDSETSHLLAQLVISGTIQFLGFARVNSGYSEELASLVDDGVLARFDLQPLTAEDVADVCRNLLEGSIARGAIDYFCEESGGNPLYLRSMVLHALSSQCLIESEDVHVLLYQPEEVDPSLRDLVSSTVRDLSPAERDALDSVALAGGVPFRSLAAVAGEAEVRSLMARGLLGASEQDQTVAVCTPPLFAEILRALVPSGRRTELKHRLLPPGAAVPAFGHHRIRQLVWALDSNEIIEDEVLVQAAQVACTMFDPAAALRLAGAVRSPGLAVAAAVEIARAHFIMRRSLPEAASARALIRSAPDDESLASAAVLAAQLELAVTGRVQAVLDIADSWEARLRERAGDRQPDGTSGSQLQRVGLLRAFGLNLEGAFETSEQILVELLELPLPPKHTALVHALLGEALGATGRSQAGLKHLETALDLVHADRFFLGELRDLVILRHVALLIHNGESEQAQLAITRYRDEPSRDYIFSGGTLGVLQGLLHLRLGRFSEGHEDLRQAIAALRLSDQDVMLPYALGLYSWSAAVLGQHELCERILQEFDVQTERGSAPFFLLATAYATAARDRLKPSKDALGELSRLADEAASGGLTGCEKDILEMLVLLGSDAHVARLVRVTARTEGPEAAILHDYATALEMQDAHLLLAAGDAAEAHGKQFVAVDASARALRIFAAQGDQKSQRNVLRILRYRRAQLEHPVASDASGVNDLKDLTSRELNIATLAASGLSNRDIAKFLTVSTRTVEGHLYRIYVKLGITRRDELAGVVEAHSNPRNHLSSNG